MTDAKQQVLVAGYQGPASILTRSLRDLQQRLAEIGGDGWDVKFEEDITATGESAASLFRSVDVGERQLSCIATGYLTATVSSLGILDLPFCVKDRKLALGALDGEAGDILSSDVESKTAYHVLGYWDNGFRHLTNGVRPVRGVEDAGGMRIRTLNSALYREVLTAMGFVAVTTDVKDLVRVVQQREVDGQENPLTNFVNFGLWQYNPYLSMSGHFFGVLLLVCHRPWFESLSAEQQTLVQEAAQHATRLQRELAASEDETLLEVLAQHSMEILHPQDLDLASMRSATRHIVERERAGLDPALVRSYLDSL